MPLQSFLGSNLPILKISWKSAHDFLCYPDKKHISHTEKNSSRKTNPLGSGRCNRGSIWQKFMHKEDINNMNETDNKLQDLGEIGS